MLRGKIIVYISLHDNFDEIKTFSVETDANMILKRNTFPRLKKVEIVEEL